MKNATTRKGARLAALSLALVLLLAACSTFSSTSLTYHVDNGDVVTVTLDTKTGYKQTTDVPFAITKDDEEIVQGTFGYASTYDQYKELLDAALETDESGVKLIEASKKDGNDYLFYQYEGQVGTEYDYIIKIADSDTAVIMGSLVSQEAAEDVFNALTFSVEKE